MIKLENVSINYGKKKVLKEITIDFPVGQMIGIVGENGSGKTTLLKVIAGLSSPKSGTVTFRQENLTRRMARDIAYMSDADNLFPYFTVQQLFDYYASQFDDFQMVKAKEIAQFLNVPLSAKMNRLSKGNRGRAKIAATLGRNAKYYVLDEPFSGLDPMVRDDIAKGLIQFTDIESQTIILSTHEIKEMEPLLDEIVVLREGQIIAQKAIDEIRDQYGMDATSWMVSLFN